MFGDKDVECDLLPVAERVRGRGCVEINQCVTCRRCRRRPMLGPSSGEERHRYAIEQASRRWRGGVQDEWP